MSSMSTRVRFLFSVPSSMNFVAGCSSFLFSVGKTMFIQLMLFCIISSQFISNMTDFNFHIKIYHVAYLATVSLCVY